MTDTITPEDEDRRTLTEEKGKALAYSYRQAVEWAQMHGAPKPILHYFRQKP